MQCPVTLCLRPRTSASPLTAGGTWVLTWPLPVFRVPGTHIRPPPAHSLHVAVTGILDFTSPTETDSANSCLRAEWPGCLAHCLNQNPGPHPRLHPARCQSYLGVSLHILQCYRRCYRYCLVHATSLFTGDLHNPQQSPPRPNSRHIILPKHLCFDPCSDASF